MVFLINSEQPIIYRHRKINRPLGNFGLGYITHGPLALDAFLIPKISNRHFFQDIKNYFYEVTQIGLKPHQIFFQFFSSTNMVARGVQIFCILEGTTDPPIEQ